MYASSTPRLRAPTTLGRAGLRMALALAMTAASVGLAGVRSQPAVAATVQRSQTFTFTGGPQTFTVPPGVTTLELTADGASGGAGAALQSGIASGAGGLGGEVTARAIVSGGQALSISVGGQGAYARRLPRDGPRRSRTRR